MVGLRQPSAHLNVHRTASQSMTARATSTPPFGWCLAAVGLGLVLVLASGTNLVDDAFISMRYAANFAHGHGLVFNAGAHVEGFSNPATTLLLSVASALGLPLPQVAVAIGVLAYLATIPVSIVLASRLGARPLTAGVAGLTVALSTQLVGSSTNGLETTLFAFALTSSILLLSEPTIRPWLLGGSLALLVMVRPEGPVLAILLVLTSLVVRRAIRFTDPRLWRVGAVVCAVVGMLFAVRYAYYGRLLPTSVTAKRDLDVGVLGALTRNAGDGFDYLRHALTGGGLLVVAASAVVLAVAWRPRGQARVIAVSTVVATLVGILLVLGNGGDWMPAGRMIAPYLPAVLVVLIAGVDGLTSRLPLGVALAALLVALQPWGAFVESRGEFAFGGPWGHFGSELAAALPRGTEVTTNILGELAYEAPTLRFFDVYGLVEPSIAERRVPASIVGKDGMALAARRDNVAIVTNHWMVLNAIVDASRSSYQALVSPTLVRNNLFVAVRSDQAQRFAPLVRDGARLVDMDDAVEYWSARAPTGQFL
jgi:hypothetical protein